MPSGFLTEISDPIRSTPSRCRLGGLDGFIDVDDLVRVIVAWGPCAGCNEDVNGDLTVNVDDLVAVILAWGS